MRASMLEKLPAELLTRICEYTDSAAVSSISRTCQQCHRAAVGVLFREIIVDFDDLTTDVEQWTAVLKRVKAFDAPRLLRIVALERWKAAKRSSDDDPVLNGSDNIHDLTRSDRSQASGVEATVRPLLALMRRLPSLSKLFWHIDSPPKTTLTDALRDELTNCGLHLPACYPSRHDLNSLLQVLSLPNLRTIWFKHTFEDVNDLAVRRALAGSAFNLKDVRMFWASVGASPFGYDVPKWNPPKLVSPHPLGQLQTLQLAGIGPADHKGLCEWTTYADFNSLRTLCIEIPLRVDQLKYLSSLPFQALRSLGLVLYNSEPEEGYSANAREFLRGLRPLSTLRLKGGVTTEARDAILAHHSSALHTLYLIPCSKDAASFVLDKEAIQGIGTSCSILENLRITIARNWRQKDQDVEKLRAIGFMPRLKELTLDLDASNSKLLEEPEGLTDEEWDSYETPSDPAFSEQENRYYGNTFMGALAPRVGHIKDAMINSAIDEKMAKDVFHLIRDGHSTPLRRLELRAVGGGHFGTSVVDQSLDDVVQEIGKGWGVERQGPGEDLKTSPRRSKRAMFVAEDKEFPSLHRRVEEIFRQIWPGKGDWTKQWHSFPL